MAGRRGRAALLALASLAAALAILLVAGRPPDGPPSDAPPRSAASSAPTPVPLADSRPGRPPAPPRPSVPSEPAADARARLEPRPRVAVRAATTCVVDELGQALAGVSLFLDLGGRCPKSRSAGLLDPTELDSLRRDDPETLSRWTRVTDRAGCVDWGPIDAGISSDMDDVVVLFAPRRGPRGEGPASWRRLGSTSSADAVSWTLRVRRGAGGFTARLGGVGSQPHLRVQPRLANGLFQFGGIEGTRLEVERGPGADATVVGEGYPDGTYRLVAVTQDGRALEAVFDVADGERTSVTQWVDLGATAVNGILEGSACGKVDTILVRVLDTDPPDTTRFIDTSLRLPVSADGRFRVPVLPGTRRVGLSIPDVGGESGWALSPATFETPLPKPLRVDSSPSAHARVRVVDAAGRTSRGAIVQVFARPRGASGTGDRILGYACTPTFGDGTLDPVVGFPGTWVVQVWPPNGDINTSPPTVEVEATVAAGEPSEVVVRLP